MNQPSSWSDVLNCSCLSCLALKEIYARCRSTEEPLFVCDCRMHTTDRPWVVSDIKTVFASGGPAASENKFDTMEAAVAAVLASQRHCDMFLSSWPMKPAGSRDYLWHREEAAA